MQLREEHGGTSALFRGLLLLLASWHLVLADLVDAKGVCADMRAISWSVTF